MCHSFTYFSEERKHAKYVGPTNGKIYSEFRDIKIWKKNVS